MNGYRTATHLDLAYIFRMLTDGDEKGVLVRDVNKVGEIPYPLMEISEGPYELTAEGIEGYAVGGVWHLLRIADNALHNVELKTATLEWYSAGGMPSVILLVPQ